MPNGKPESGPLTDLSLVEAEDGALEGQVFFVQRAGIRRGRLALSGLTYLKDHAVLGNAETAGPHAVEIRYEAARSRVRAVWRLQRQRTIREGWDHEFGVADVLLLRTGECRISVNPTEQSLWMQLGGLDVITTLSPQTIKKLENLICKAAAEAVFLAVRDVAHKHYHHSGDRAVDGPVTPLTSQDDETWRRRTLEGLMRMCIGLRRKATAASLRHSLGVLAYIDAFDRHLGKWHMKDGLPKAIKSPTYYDLSALKNSIDAALKVRELADQALRNRLLFVFGLVITTVTVVAPAYRAQVAGRLENQDLSGSAGMFSGLIKFMVDQPISAILIACLLGWWVDKMVNFFSHQRPIEAWEAAQTRITSLVVATARAITPGSKEAQNLVILILLGGAAGCAFAWWSIFQDFSVSIFPIFSGAHEWLVSVLRYVIPV